MLQRSLIALVAIMAAQMQMLTLSAAEHGGESTIAYRLVEDKTMHFDELQKASEHLEAVKKLGCEVAPAGHDGHNDVTYRCPKWKSLTVATDELAHQWEEWFQAAGFETLHGHNEAPAQGAIAVHFMMPQSKHMHVNDPAQVKEFTAIFTGLGCTVEQAQHSGHIDLTIKCPKWRNLVFDTHDEAHAVQKWLDQQGFKTQHNH